MTVHQDRAIPRGCEGSDTQYVSPLLDENHCVILDFYPRSMVLRPRTRFDGPVIGDASLARLRQNMGARFNSLRNHDVGDFTINDYEFDELVALDAGQAQPVSYWVMTRVVGQGHIAVLLAPIAMAAATSIAGSDRYQRKWRQKLFDNALFRSNAKPDEEVGENHGLSPRMIECLRWTAAGKTSEEIGIILELSSHTVNNYLSAATLKLNAVNRVQAVASAMSLGIITIPQGS
ncbi:MAG: helix-turn-helix transcriptional regulator [Pseudomonadota bacterium]